VMHSAIVHVDFHRLRDPVSRISIALLVSAFQNLINEVFLITFLSLRSTDKLQQSVARKTSCGHRFFGPYHW
jgi:hypothetical protein